MLKVKTAELTGAALDWAVAKFEGVPEYILNKPYRASELIEQYSADWTQGGLIIEREWISVCWQGATWVGSKFNVRITDEYEFQQTGTTPLIAAMRCYVASKLGDTVEIPKELVSC